MNEQSGEMSYIDSSVVRSPEGQDLAERLIGMTGVNLVIQHTRPQQEELQQAQQTAMMRLFSIIRRQR